MEFGVRAQKYGAWELHFALIALIRAILARHGHGGLIREGEIGKQRIVDEQVGVKTVAKSLPCGQILGQSSWGWQQHPC